MSFLRLADHPKFVMWHKKWTENNSYSPNEINNQITNSHDMQGSIDVINALQQLLNMGTSNIEGLPPVEGAVNLQGLGGKPGCFQSDPSGTFVVNDPIQNSQSDGNFQYQGDKLDSNLYPDPSISSKNTNDVPQNSCSSTSFEVTSISDQQSSQVNESCGINNQNILSNTDSLQTTDDISRTCEDTLESSSNEVEEKTEVDRKQLEETKKVCEDSQTHSNKDGDSKRIISEEGTSYDAKSNEKNELDNLDVTNKNTSEETQATINVLKDEEVKQELNDDALKARDEKLEKSEEKLNENEVTEKLDLETTELCNTETSSKSSKIESENTAKTDVDNIDLENKDKLIEAEKNQLEELQDSSTVQDQEDNSMDSSQLGIKDTDQINPEDKSYSFKIPNEDQNDVKVQDETDVTAKELKYSIDNSDSKICDEISSDGKDKHKDEIDDISLNKTTNDEIDKVSSDVIIPDKESVIDKDMNSSEKINIDEKDILEKFSINSNQQEIRNIELPNKSSVEEVLSSIELNNEIENPTNTSIEKEKVDENLEEKEKSTIESKNNELQDNVQLAEDFILNDASLLSNVKPSQELDITDQPQSESFLCDPSQNNILPGNIQDTKGDDNLEIKDDILGHDDEFLDDPDDLGIDLGGLTSGEGGGGSDLVALLSSQEDLDQIMSQENPELSSLDVSAPHVAGNFDKCFFNFIVHNIYQSDTK